MIRPGGSGLTMLRRVPPSFACARAVVVTAAAPAVAIRPRLVMCMLCLPVVAARLSKFAWIGNLVGRKTPAKAGGLPPSGATDDHLLVCDVPEREARVSRRIAP